MSEVKALIVSCLHYGNTADSTWVNQGITEKIRRYSTHRTRGQACVTAANNKAVNLFLDLGDKIDFNTDTPWDYLDNWVTDITGLNSGIQVATVWGNHESIAGLGGDYAAYYAAVEAADNHVTKENFDIENFPYYYTFELNGIGFIVFRSIGVQSSRDWLAARLSEFAAAGTPVVILHHELLWSITQSYAYASDHAQIRTVIEDSGAVILAVFCGHYHRSKVDAVSTVINGINYYGIEGSVFAPRVDDNAYYVAHIRSNGNVSIEGFGKGSLYGVA